MCREIVASSPHEIFLMMSPMKSHPIYFLLTYNMFEFHLISAPKENVEKNQESNREIGLGLNFR